MSTTASTSTTTAATTVTTLKLLLAGQAPAIVAAATHTTPEAVFELAEANGWPDPAKTRRALDSAAGGATSAAGTSTAPRRQQPRPAIPAPSAPHAPPTPALAAPVDQGLLALPLAQLLARAQRAGSKRITTQAGKVQAAVDRLAQALQQHEHAARAKAAEVAKKAKARAEVERLEHELALARAAAGLTTRGPRSNGRGRDVRHIRTWAKTQGLQVADHGRIPDPIMAAYFESHPKSEA